MKKLSIVALLCVSFASTASLSALTSNPCAQLSTTSGWNYNINIKNSCATPLNLAGATVYFSTNAALNSNSVWGFSGLSYPTNATLTSLGQNGASYQYSYTYQFGSWASLVNQQLAAGQSTNITFSPSTDPSLFVVNNLSLVTTGSPVVNTGSISFSANSTLPSSTVIKLTGSTNQYTLQNSFNGSQYTMNGLAFDTYQLSGYYLSGATQIPLSFSPTVVTLSSSHTAQAVSVTVPVVTMVNVNLNMTAKPNDNVAAQVPVTLTDTTRNSTQSVAVSWGQTLPVAVIVGDNISLAASNLTGLYKSYQFNFSPSQFKVGTAGQNVQISYTTTSLPTGTVKMSVSGLPSGQATSLSFSNLNNAAQVYSFTLSNGNVSNNLPTGTYSVSAGNLSINGQNYFAAVNPAQFVVSTGATVSVNAAYSASAGVSFSPYFDTTVNADWNANQPGNLSSYLQTTGVKSLHTAFITDAGQCVPAWAGISSMPATGGSSAWGYAWFSNIHSQNVATIIAFGGANGTDISQNCSNSALVAAYQNVITSYNPQGLDFDIEGQLVANPTAYQNIINALVKIQAQYPTLPISFTLPVMPDGLTANGLDVIQKAKNAGLNFKVNIMAMDYGPSYASDMGQYAIQAIDALEAQLATIYGNSKSSVELYNMIQVTPMIGVNDVAGEFFTLQDARAVAAYASQKGLSMTSMWSQARDVPCNGQWASPTCSGASNGTNAQSNVGDFAKAFLNSNS